ncbi:MAG: M1 family metallopeptidase [Longimicrobiales bacterium]
MRQRTLIGGLAVAALGGCTDPETMRDLAVPGVSHALAEERARTISDVRYDLHLDVTDSARAAGSVTIDFVRAADAADAIVDFRGPSLSEVRVNDAAVPGVVWDSQHVRIPAAHLVDGANRVAFTFQAAIAPAGASIIRYDDTTDGSRYLYTLLVPSDAQQLFPVFDQPDLKARLTLHMTAAEDWQVLANAPSVRRTPGDNATITWDFAETRPLSTYLFAFAAGPWTVFEESPGAANAALREGYRGTLGVPIRYRTIRDGRVIEQSNTAAAHPMRLFVRRSRASEVDADTIMRINREARQWLEAYFDMPYPFAKMDMLLAPAFPFGGMEHAGAIFYNESRIIFRERPTLARRLGRAATIYHEVAHQWFGDLVTMAWFDDLWLKEGFATYMAARIQADLEPESGAWKTFYLRNKPSAYAVDVTAGTTPVWQRLPNLDLAKSNYGAIVYNKAPSVLKQLEFLVGDTAFRAGLQTFLGRHAYANARWPDLLSAIGEAAGEGLTQFGEQYILRPGLPRVETALALEGGRIRELALVQRPVNVLDGDPGGWWPGRIVVRIGYDDRDDVLLPVAFDGERTIVEDAAGLPAPDWILPNDGDYGYGLFLPDALSAQWLLENAGTLRDDLLRTIAWGALWELVREGRIAPAAFVARAIDALPAERDEQIAGAVIGRAGHALERYIADGPDGERLASKMEAMLLARAGDVNLDYGVRKSALDAYIDGATSDDARAVLRAFLSGERRFAGEPLGQPSRWSAVTRLLALGDPAADSLYTAERARDRSPEAERLAFIAGAAVPSGQNKEAYFKRFFEDASLNEEWVTASLGAFNDPRHTQLTLRYLRPALDRTEWIRDNRRIFFLPSWIDGFLSGLATEDALATVDAFLAERAALPEDIRRRVLQARDDLERAVRLRGATHAQSVPSP